MRKKPYIGSVRFFKNLILLAVVVLIVAPTTAAVRTSGKSGSLARENAELQASVETLTARMNELQEELNGFAWLNTAEPPAYRDLYPDLYVSGTPRNSYAEQTVYLTFDDGPSARTEEILKILDQYGVKATFFVVGPDSEARRARLQAIAEAGHTIGVHSYTHEYRAVYQSVESYLEDFYQTYQMILDATGVAPTVFRFPGGSINTYNSGLYQEIIAEMLRRGFVYFDWNVSAQDAAGDSVSCDAVLSSILNGAEGKSRCVVLMHDSAAKRGTVAALPALIETLRGRGYAFDRLTRDVQPVIFGY